MKIKTYKKIFFIFLSIIFLFILAYFSYIKLFGHEAFLLEKSERYNCYKKPLPFQACYCECVNQSNTKNAYERCVRKNDCQFID